MSGLMYHVVVNTSEDGVATVITTNGEMLKLVPGKTYRLITRAYNQRLARESVMRFMEMGRDGELRFDARPMFGTQRMLPRDLVDAVEVPASTKQVMNKVVR